jgi:hypothetical protein
MERRMVSRMFGGGGGDGAERDVTEATADSADPDVYARLRRGGDVVPE